MKRVAMLMHLFVQQCGLPDHTLKTMDWTAMSALSRGGSEVVVSKQLRATAHPNTEADKAQ